jgi:malonate transporter MadM subunit
MIIETLQAVMIKNSIITAFVFVAVVMWVSYWLSDRLTRGHVHGSAIAIALGLLIAYVGGAFTGGSKGIADIPMLTGVGILGGAMFRDFAIVATAFGADLDSIRKAGWVGAMSVILGVIISFIVGAVVAVLFGYTDAVSISTIGAGAATYIVALSRGQRSVRGQMSSPLVLLLVSSNQCL